MTAIHQVLPAASPHDAITDQAFVWRDLLHGWGYESEILAQHVHPALTDTAYTLDRAGQTPREPRRRCPALRALERHGGGRAAVEGPVALYYHNITPGELLRDFSPASADLCDRGRAALTVFQGRIESSIAVSRFNAADLRDAGLGEATVVPLLLEVPTEVPRRNPSREPVVLTVGRIVPNKRLEDVVKAFTIFQRHREPEASL